MEKNDRGVVIQQKTTSKKSCLRNDIGETVRQENNLGEVIQQEITSKKPYDRIDLGEVIL